MIRITIRLPQWLCPHWKIWYVGDAFDTKFECHWCGKIWWNATPSDLRWTFPFEWNGHKFHVRGGIVSKCEADRE